MGFIILFGAIALIGGGVVAVLVFKLFSGGGVNKAVLEKAVESNKAIIALEGSMHNILCNCNKATAVAIKKQIGEHRFRSYVKEDNRCLLDS